MALLQFHGPDMAGRGLPRRLAGGFSIARRGGGLDWRKNLGKSWWHCCSSMVRTAWPAEASPSPGGRIQYSQEGGRARLEEKFGQVGIAGRGIPVTWRADSV